MLLDFNSFKKQFYNFKYLCYYRSKKDTTSVYKRLSAHITLDLPDLPELSDALRETANKVESIMAQARHSTETSK